MHPLTGSGSNPQSVTVSGEVWLDNNGDNSLDHGEMGFPGIKVNLINVSVGGEHSTTTNASVNGDNYNFTFQPYATYNYQIQVVFPLGCEAVTPSAMSDINAQGYSQVFALAPGAVVNKPEGVKSMNVTTTQDDANAPIQGQITLRDAIETGNNGGGVQVTFAQNVTGTISLQAALDPIKTNYFIAGPGSATLTVQGQDDPLNAYSIFTVNTGVQSRISGLSITGGYNLHGGGVNNSGALTLYEDSIFNNTAADFGGGVYSGKGDILSVQESSIYLNGSSRFRVGSFQP